MQAPPAGHPRRRVLISFSPQGRVTGTLHTNQRLVRNHKRKKWASKFFSVYARTRALHRSSQAGETRRSGGGVTRARSSAFAAARCWSISLLRLRTAVVKFRARSFVWTSTRSGELCGSSASRGRDMERWEGRRSRHMPAETEGLVSVCGPLLPAPGASGLFASRGMLTLDCPASRARLRR